LVGLVFLDRHLALLGMCHFDAGDLAVRDVDERRMLAVLVKLVLAILFDLVAGKALAVEMLVLLRPLLLLAALAVLLVLLLAFPLRLGRSVDRYQRERRERHRENPQDRNHGLLLGGLYKDQTPRHRLRFT